MGNEISGDAKIVIKKVMDLRRDHTNWKSVIEEFNTVVPADYSAKKFEDKRIVDLVLQLLATQLKDNPNDQRGITNLLEASRRLLRFKGLYKMLGKCNVWPWIQALQHNHPEIAESALVVMRNFIEYTGLETKEDKKILMESQARDLLFQSKGLFSLVDLLQRYAGTQMWSIIAGTLRIFSILLLTSPKSTPADAVGPIVGALHQMIGKLLEMSYDPNPDVCYFGILTVQAVILHSDSKSTKNIQNLALSNGCLLRHFYLSVNGEQTLQEKQQIGANAKAIVLESRNLIGLLTDGHTKATDTLQRCLPNHLLKRLWENHPFPKVFTFAKIRASVSSSDTTWQRYMKGSHRANWIAVFVELDKEHNLPHLIWNDTTRHELLDTLNLEVLELEHQKKRNPAAEWDFEGFEPHYASVEAELQVHGYYLKGLIATLIDSSSTYEINQKDLVALINHLYNHAVIEDKPVWKWACIRAMSALYKRYSQVLLDFEPLAYFVWLMSPKHTRPLWRDEILVFFQDLLQHQPNARRFMQADGVKFLVTYMSQAHNGPEKFLQGRQMSLEPLYAVPMTFNSSYTPSTPTIHEGPDREKEQDSDEFGLLPVPLTNGQLADLCIDLLKLLLNRVPRLCKSITKTPEFQHILQFLLSSNHEQSNKILPVITQLSLSSVSAQSTLAQRGAFRFTFYAMDDQSDIAAIQLLHMFHMKQSEETVQFGKSALHSFLPFPMIRYLQLQSPERFQEVFDGDVNQPDLIWNKSLRTRLVETVRNDMREFVDVLRDRPMTLYSHSEPTTIIYPELIDEVCCGGIYLRNFVANPSFNVPDPSFMMNGFVDAIKFGLKNLDLELLIQSQIIAVERYPDLPDCGSYPVFVELLQIMTRDIREDLDLRLVDKSADLLHRLLSIPNSENISICLANDGFVASSQSLLNIVQLDSSDKRTEPSIQKLIRIMNILSFANEEAFLTMHENPQVVIELVSLISNQYAIDHPGVAVEALRLFNILAESAVTCRDLLTSGAILSIINISMFFDEQSDLAREAALALTALSGVKATRETGDDDIRFVLQYLLTPGLLARLGKSDRFVKECRSTFYNPCLIWGAEQRNELQTFILAQMALIEKERMWNNYKDKLQSFHFSSIASEIQVSDVFLKLYNQQEDYSIPNDPVEFLSALVEHLRTVAMSLQSASAENLESIIGNVEITAISARRLQKDTQSLCKSPAQDSLVALISNLFDTLHPYIIHACVLVLDVLSKAPTSFAITTQYAFVLHRVVNFKRPSINAMPDLEMTLRLLHHLCCKDPEIVDAFFDDGFIITLMNILCDITKEAAESRIITAQIMGTLVSDSRKGEAYMDMFSHLLAPTFRDFLSEAVRQPTALISFYDEDHDTPIVFWKDECRQDLVVFVKQELQGLVAHQKDALEYGVGAAPYQWDWATIHERFNQKTLGAEIYIDGIYINAFNANPYFQVKPDRFFLKLVEALYGVFHEYETFRDENQTEWVKTSIKNLLALWEAVLNLLTNLPHLQDRCVDYLDYIFGYFHPSVDTVLQKVALKIACILATNTLCAENIAKFRLVKNVMPLLETLRKEDCIHQVLSFLLDVIRRSSPVVAQIKSTGGVIMLLNVILDKTIKQDDRENAAMIVSAMVQDNVFGVVIASYVVLILTDKFKTIFQSRPSKFIEFIDSDHTSSADNRVWNSKTRTAVTDILKSQSGDLSTAMWFWDGVCDVWDISQLSVVWADIPKSSPVEQEAVPDASNANDVKAADDAASMISMKEELG